MPPRRRKVPKSFGCPPVRNFGAWRESNAVTLTAPAHRTTPFVRDGDIISIEGEMTDLEIELWIEMQIEPWGHGSASHRSGQSGMLSASARFPGARAAECHYPSGATKETICYADQ